MPQDKKKDDILHMRVSADFWQLVDDWRREQPDIPVRSEAVRRMVRIAAEAAAKGKKR